MSILNKNLSPSFSLSQLYRDARLAAKQGLARSKSLLKPAAICGLALAANSAFAADWDIPGVSAIDGLGDADDPGSMILIIGKWILKVVLWLVALVTGIVVVRNIAKAINKVHRDEDGRWGAVIGEIVGNIVTFLFILGFAAWMSSQFL
jgi:hypothetical protein